MEAIQVLSFFKNNIKPQNMLSIEKFLEDRVQIQNALPMDFDLHNCICEDTNTIQIELCVNSYSLHINGSVTCHRTYFRHQDWENPEESTEEYEVEIYDGELFDAEGDKIKDLNELELEQVKQVIKSMY